MRRRQLWRTGYLVLSGFVLLILPGCTVAGLRERASALLAPPQADLAAVPRTPGEKPAASLEATAKKAFCSGAVQTGIVYLEQADVTPRAVLPGQEVQQRIVYVVCPGTSAISVSGKIVRTVKADGKLVTKDETRHTFKPGSWIVDAALVVPDSAPSGEYTLDVALRYGKSEVKKGNTFFVQKERAD